MARIRVMLCRDGKGRYNDCVGYGTPLPGHRLVGRNAIAYAVLGGISTFRAIYSSRTFREKPLTVLRSFFAVVRMSSASSAVQRMSMDDLSVDMWRVQSGNLWQDSAGNPRKQGGTRLYLSEEHTSSKEKQQGGVL